ncbi:AraC family transcriptional regulator [Roseomonas fluvialis]|uniref:AraC family transcriptional regulator n=1 Tax=Roseomonas fluvialis TaxID=1750527 RepID=A0ABN6NWX8_9PROT|nr:helix-turn-helix domain-containing protein [Roseomonas fluvialis]BDG70919.1 AraC family transcriptional regulator [Roseomonas fluvialis]
MPLLGRHVVLDTRSVSVARDANRLFRGPLHLSPLGDPAAFRLVVATAAIDTIRLSAVTSTGHAIGLVEDDAITLLAPYRGIIATDTTAGRLEARAGDLVAPRRGPRRTLVGEDYVGLVVQVSTGSLRLSASHNPEDGAVLARAIDGGFDRRSAGSATAVLARYLRYLAAEVDHDTTVLRAPRGAQAAANMVTALVLDCFAAVAATTAPQRAAAAGRRHVERAEAAIRARVGEDLSVPALAAELGVGTRALQLAFRAHRGVTPREAIATARLDAAHALLSAASPAASVTGIALDCGVTHLGRFAAHYRDRFGEAPSETLARTRRSD